MTLDRSRKASAAERLRRSLGCGCKLISEATGKPEVVVAAWLAGVRDPDTHNIEEYHEFKRHIIGKTNALLPTYARNIIPMLNAINRNDLAGSIQRKYYEYMAFNLDPLEIINKVAKYEESPTVLVPFLTRVFPENYFDSDSAKIAWRCFGATADEQIQTFETIGGIVAGYRGESGAIPAALSHVAAAAWAFSHAYWERSYMVVLETSQKVQARGVALQSIPQYWRERRSVTIELAVAHSLAQANPESADAFNRYDVHLLAAQQACGFGYLCCVCYCLRHRRPDVADRFLREATPENSALRGCEAEFDFRLNVMTAVFEQRYGSALKALEHYKAAASQFHKAAASQARWVTDDPVIFKIIELGLMETGGIKQRARWFGSTKRDLPDNYCLFTIEELVRWIDRLKKSNAI